ncbi:triose-phosphate isomerase [Bifidobacterium catulorum]|uniref:Triosephosphate isomerase n=2 Tax=Bifidobacterium catulorum TaxID=1630173 RepID=A0A2U2MVF4_9BIFI|nr:triose-phosphate isomerase [Bifidobacterium catulorum]
MTMAVIALSLKMYFPRRRTVDYCRTLAGLLTERGIGDSGPTMAVLPDFLTLAEVQGILAPVNVRVGAQDMCADDRGAFTGEVSGSDLRDLGASVVELGHVERRTLFHEDDGMVARKVRAAWRNGLTPLLCVGETEREGATAAAERCLGQIASAVGDDRESPLWVAYEPRWAIGASEPASAEYVREVCDRIKQSLGERPSAVLYGGSAGPGLLSRLWPSVDGLFLGRFAHDPHAFMSVVDEAIGLENGDSENK